MPFAALSTSAVQAEASVLTTIIPDSVQNGFTNFANASQKTLEFYDKIADFFSNFKENVATMSIDLLAWTFEFLTKTILYTPAFLFNTDIIRESTFVFTGLSVVGVSMLTLYEGFIRMFQTKSAATLTDTKQIYKKIPLVIGISTIAPYLFYQTFKGINWLTRFIIDIGGEQIKEGFKGIDFSVFSMIDVTLFAAFDLALIFFLIPIVLQNFKRWFDLILLATLTPLALSASIFKSQEHLFKKWFTNIKAKSIQQLVYAIYLVIISAIVFGTKTPDSVLDGLTKIGIFIGGLYSLHNPPSFIRNLGSPNDSIDEYWKGASNAAKPNKSTEKLVGYVKRIFTKGKVVPAPAAPPSKK